MVEITDEIEPAGANEPLEEDDQSNSNEEWTKLMGENIQLKVRTSANRIIWFERQSFYISIN